jgi:hypothetical protein
MATSGVTGDTPSWRYLPVALALVLPILACVGWTWLQAHNAQRLEGETAARIVRAQAESILIQSQDMLGRVAEQAGKPCDEVLPMLQRWGTLNPYFRSLVLVRNQRVYCSSAVGAVDASLDDFSKWKINIVSDHWQISVAGTPLAPERPAILIGKSGADGHGGIVVVDGRYVQDLVNAVATMDDLQLELVVGRNGAPIRSDSWGGAAARAVPLRDEDDATATGRQRPWCARGPGPWRRICRWRCCSGWAWPWPRTGCRSAGVRSRNACAAPCGLASSWCTTSPCTGRPRAAARAWRR